MVLLSFVGAPPNPGSHISAGSDTECAFEAEAVFTRVSCSAHVEHHVMVHVV